MSPAARHTPQEQEDMVMAAAAKCIEAKSLLAFTMADISKEAGLSMGSVYKHVQSKEDVLVALVVRSMVHMHRIFVDFFELPLTAAEKVLGGVLWTPEKLYLHPFGVHLEMMIRNEAVMAKASPRWIESMSRIDQEMEDLFVSTLERACTEGELDVSPPERAGVIEQLMIGVWSMYVGFVQVAYQRNGRALGQGDVALPFPLPTDHALVCATQRLINSYPWKAPLDASSIERVASLMENKGYR